MKYKLTKRGAIFDNSKKKNYHPHSCWPQYGIFSTFVIQADQSPLLNEGPLLVCELSIHKIEKLYEVGAGGDVAQPHDVNPHAA